MSETQPDTLATDRVHTLPIDATGELARFAVGGGPGFSRTSTLELRIEGDAAAAYHLEFGLEDSEDRDTIHWYEVPDDFAYASTTTVEDAWQQSRRFVRVMVDEAATAGSTATVSLAYGR